MKAGGFELRDKQFWLYHNHPLPLPAESKSCGCTQRCMSAENAVEWMVDRLLFQISGGRAVLCYLDFHEVVVPVLRLVARFDRESDFFSSVRGFLDLSRAFAERGVLRPGDNCQKAVEKLEKLKLSMEGNRDEDVEVRKHSRSHINKQV